MCLFGFEFAYPGAAFRRHRWVDFNCRNWRDASLRKRAFPDA